MKNKELVAQLLDKDPEAPVELRIQTRDYSYLFAPLNHLTTYKIYEEGPSIILLHSVETISGKP